MSTNNPRRPTPGWRGAAKPAPRAEAAQPGWKRPSPTGPAKPWKLSRGGKFGIGFGVFVLLVVGLAVLILYIMPPRPAGLVVAGAGYQDNLSLPHNSHGWRGLTDLVEVVTQAPAGWSWFTAGPMNLVTNPVRLKEGKDWNPDKWWNDSKEKTLVVVLSLHGAVDDKGPFFYLESPLSEQPNKLRLDQVIQDLKPKGGRNVVLILDVTAMTDHWPAGVFHNDFARQLEALSDRVRDSQNMVVLSASAPDQQSWASDEWGRSVFLHYVTEGLAGSADGRDGKGGDGQVSLLELHQYVAGRVERWAHDNRAAPQTPMLLPLGEAGLERARGIHLVSVPKEPRPETPPDQAPNREFDKTEAVVAAWQAHDQLLAASPPPYTYRPVEWRRYEAMLIRWEQLLRAGDPEAGKLSRLLTALHADLEAAAGLGLGARADALYLLPLAGRDDDRPRSTRVKLWDAPAGTLGDVWDKEKGDDLFQLRVVGELVDHATRDTATTADVLKAYEILKVIDGGRNERPVEAHTLAMFALDARERARLKQAALGDEHLRQVLQTCRDAQKAAAAAPRPGERGLPAYSEFVYPWIKDRVLAGDALRQAGENRLFASRDALVAERAESLVNARKAYADAAARGKTVRQALALYHLASDWLPQYADYVAHKRPGAQRDGDLDAVEAAAREVETLGGLLTDPSAGEAALKLKLADAEARFGPLRKKFTEETDALIGSKERLPVRWHDLENVLRVASVPAETRGQLLAALRRTSRDLNDHTSPEQSLAANLPTDPAADARARARMALAMTGHWWAKTVTGNPNAAELMKSRIMLPRPDWQAEMVAVGGDVGGWWRRMATGVAGVHEQPADEVGAAVAEIKLADRLGRQMDGGQAWYLLDVRKAPDPGEEYRRLHQRDYLHQMAARTQADHWWCEEGTTPYYNAAGDRFLKAAGKLTLANSKLVDHFAREGDSRRKGLDVAGLSIQGPKSPVDVTDQNSVEVRDARVIAAPLVPAGEVSYWLESDVATVAGKSPHAERLLRAISPPADPKAPPAETPLEKFSLSRKSVLPGDTVTATYQIRYRGQKVEYPIAFQIEGRPTLVVRRFPTAEQCRVAVQGDKALLDDLKWKQLKISIIFDRTSSMTGEKRRKATRALQEALKKIGPGAEVRLWAFGLTSSRTGNDGAPLVPPSLVGKVDSWKLGDDEDLMAKLEAARTDPNSWSPVVRAMHHVVKEDFETIKGGDDEDKFKVLLVLTDGEDNCFEPWPDPRHNGDVELRQHGKTVAEFLKWRFDPKVSPVKVVVACFQPGANKALKDRVEKQFGVVNEINPALNTFKFVEEEDELKAVFEGAVKVTHLLYRMRAESTPDTGLVELRKGLRTLNVTSKEEKSLSHSLQFKDGTYMGRVPFVSPESLLFSPGDVMLLDFLKHTNGKQVFGLQLFKEHEETRRRHALDGKSLHGWTVAAHQNQFVKTGSRQQLLLSVETDNKDPGRVGDGAALRIRRPGFVWFDVEPADGGKAGRLEWENVGDVLGYPAPVWRLDLPDWKEGDTPKVRTFVLGRDPVIGGGLARALQAGDQELTVGGDTFTGVSVGYQRVRVKAEPESDRVVERDCLVVRATFPVGRPVMAWLDNQKKVKSGEEHRYYANTGKYTGCFWPITEAEVQERLADLRLISIEEVRKEVKRAGGPHEFTATQELLPPVHWGLQTPP